MASSKQALSTNSTLSTHSFYPSFSQSEWKYDMRRDMQWIKDQVYLGPYSVTKLLNELRSQKITHVFLIRYSMERAFVRPLYENELIYFTWDVPTQSSSTWIPHLLTFCDTLRATLSEPNHRVLVACRDGLRMSPTFVISWLMDTGMDLPLALNYVQSIRFCITLNLSLVQQLKEFVPIALARHGIHPLSKERIETKGKPRHTQVMEEEEFQENENQIDIPRKKMKKRDHVF
ncbi:hypothetical protein HMI54_015483 [Coelomomyces lativittatus]|nr:hypothetical protein HMI56_002715 [Coelomomyces lativittatus]KAJ1518125.1 hypothetical protein HMI55_002709 [Coelomomyces lativittatus]KAJ1518515.1 hypothetical protein HMI54_015483 [Coelomomyces lativittatus]